MSTTALRTRREQCNVTAVAVLTAAIEISCNPSDARGNALRGAFALTQWTGNSVQDTYTYIGGWQSRNNAPIYLARSFLTRDIMTLLWLS